MVLSKLGGHEAHALPADAKALDPADAPGRLQDVVGAEVVKPVEPFLSGDSDRDERRRQVAPAVASAVARNEVMVAEPQQSITQPYWKRNRHALV